MKIRQMQERKPLVEKLGILEEKFGSFCLERSDGRLVVISDDVLCEYENEEAYNNQ